MQNWKKTPSSAAARSERHFSRKSKVTRRFAAEGTTVSFDQKRLKGYQGDLARIEKELKDREDKLRPRIEEAYRGSLPVASDDSLDKLGEVSTMSWKRNART